MQWHDTLQVEVQKRLDAALEEAANHVRASKVQAESKPTEEAAEEIEALAHSEPTSGDRTEASRLLRNRCPACFGSRTWGRSLNE